MRYVWMMFLGFLLISCQDVEEVRRPDDLIPAEKMVEVLTDLSLINSAKNTNKRFLEETGLQPREYLYQKHNVDSLRLAESTKYYARNYNEFEWIYSRVKNNLEQMKRDLEVIQAEEQRVKDSIANTEKDSLGIPREENLRRTVVDSLGNPAEGNRKRPREIIDTLDLETEQIQ